MIYTSTGDVYEDESSHEMGVKVPSHETLKGIENGSQPVTVMAEDNPNQYPEGYVPERKPGPHYFDKNYDNQGNLIHDPNYLPGQLPSNNIEDRRTVDDSTTPTDEQLNAAADRYFGQTYSMNKLNEKLGMKELMDWEGTRNDQLLELFKHRDELLRRIPEDMKKKYPKEFQEGIDKGKRKEKVPGV